MADGALIQSRYQLLELIGRGGMGEVWRARDESLGRPVAVKCLNPLGSRQEEPFLRALRERFRREARVAAGLQHRGVTVVHDFGESEGVLFLVMELLDGHNLSQLLTARGSEPLPAAEVVDIAEQVAAALAYTHRQGIIHRDLKPANVMRLADGTVKICDFGIARLAEDIGLSAKLTGAGMAMGTPHYMSPEQIAGTPLDHRSDLYSFGCVLYEIATGAPPFDLGDPWAILIGHRDTPPEPPRAHRPDLPPELEEFILALLAKHPDDRPEDAVGHARRLAALTAAPPAPLAPAGPYPAPGPHGTDGSGLPGGPRPPRRGTAAGLPRVPVPRPPERLPDWTRGMRAGSRASGSWPLRPPPPDRSAGLTGQWTGLPGRPDPAAQGHTALAQLPAEGAGPAPEFLAVLASRHRAGESLGRLGRWAEAHEVHAALASTRARALGEEHPDTLLSRHETAYALGRLGRWEEALDLFGRVAAARERVLGPAHPDTLGTRYQTGIALGRLGLREEALDLYGTLVVAWTRAEGPAHPETLRARHARGITLGRLGRWEEALSEAREVYALRARVLSPGHPDTLVSRREIAVALGWLERWEEALAEYREVRTARERVLGPGHPDALASRNDEAHCLEQLGRAGEAVELYRQVAELRDGTAPEG
ncbi:serine/threonine-protein kinase [Streptomyces sp. DSM 44917]|uniref:non-specific serine/threonine protein kinase n=1 Tax=Streptomyces boetiae TaxID=3075541 RepID=A0ABU2LF09_9ACTN|nr:serine/threonine-protein kinase [Streptomyces sp. DSM 44917]MDT0310161.1 serine/threonine-protein kinase [Streptomyces sp. DSM 44917]